MCYVSMIIDAGLKWEPWKWQHPQTVPFFQRIYDEARRFDIETGQPECELEEKKQKVRKLAAELGLDVSFIDRPIVPKESIHVPLT